MRQAHYTRMPYPYGARLVWARALGAGCAPSLAASVWPAPRQLHIWSLFGGATFDRELRLHRIAGFLGLECTVVHGAAMAIGYISDSPAGFGFLFSLHGLMVCWPTVQFVKLRSRGRGWLTYSGLPR